MANKSVFASIKGRLLPKATTRNAHGAPAYAYSDAHALAQVAVTGTFGGMFYQSPQEELEYILDVAEAVDPHYLAQTAIYARQSGYMKDMPAVLLAVLARRDPALFRAVFGRVVDNGKMLRVFVQVVRSGQTGRKSLGSAPKAMVQYWLNTASDWALLNANIGNDPSLADVIKMVHPKPASAEREALFAWIVGRPCDMARLPQAVQDWMAFKETGKGPMPDVPFQMLTQLELSSAQWSRIARVRFHAGGVDASELPSSYKSADNVVAQIKSYDLAEIEDYIDPYGCIMAGDVPPFWVNKKKKGRR